MIPHLFSIGPIPINTFGLMVALSLLAGIYCLTRSFRLAGIPPEYAERYVLMGGIGGLIAARLWSMAENWQETSQDFFGSLFSGAGFTFYGGFIASFILLFLMSRRDKLSLSSFMDSLGPTLSLGYAIGRLGCQLSGDGDYGIATTGFWGMSYATGIVPTHPGVLVYPTPFFESTLALFIAGILLRLERKAVTSPQSLWSVPYRRFGFYLVLISLERFFVEFLRVNPKVTETLSEAQVVAIGFFILGGLLMFPKNKRGLEESPSI